MIETKKAKSIYSENKFLIFPKTINGVRKWWEKASWQIETTITTLRFEDKSVRMFLKSKNTKWL